MQENNELTRKYGRIMWGCVWLLILFFGYYIIDAWYSKQLNPNQQLQYKSENGVNSVELIRNRYHSYVTPGSINGQPVNFIVDTGATTVAIPESLAKRLKLTYGHAIQISTAGGTVTGYATRLDEIRIGSIYLANVSATITPTLDDDTLLLGMSALRDIRFTQHGNKLTLEQRY